MATTTYKFNNYTLSDKPVAFTGSKENIAPMWNGITRSAKAHGYLYKVDISRIGAAGNYTWIVYSDDGGETWVDDDTDFRFAIGRGNDPGGQRIVLTVVGNSVYVHMAWNNAGTNSWAQYKIDDDSIALQYSAALGNGPVALGSPQVTHLTDVHWDGAKFWAISPYSSAINNGYFIWEIPQANTAIVAADYAYYSQLSDETFRAACSRTYLDDDGLIWFVDLTYMGTAAVYEWRCFAYDTVNDVFKTYAASRNNAAYAPDYIYCVEKNGNRVSFISSLGIYTFPNVYTKPLRLDCLRKFVSIDDCRVNYDYTNNRILGFATRVDDEYVFYKWYKNGHFELEERIVADASLPRLTMGVDGSYWTGDGQIFSKAYSTTRITALEYAANEATATSEAIKIHVPTTMIESFGRASLGFRTDSALFTTGQHIDVVNSVGTQILFGFVAVSQRVGQSNYKVLCKSEIYFDLNQSIDILQSTNSFDILTEMANDYCGYLSPPAADGETYDTWAYIVKDTTVEQVLVDIIRKEAHIITIDREGVPVIVWSPFGEAAVASLDKTTLGKVVVNYQTQKASVVHLTGGFDVSTNQYLVSIASSNTADIDNGAILYLKYPNVKLQEELDVIAAELVDVESTEYIVIEADIYSSVVINFGDIITIDYPTVDAAPMDFMVTAIGENEFGVRHIVCVSAVVITNLIVESADRKITLLDQKVDNNNQELSDRTSVIETRLSQLQDVAWGVDEDEFIDSANWSIHANCTLTSDGPYFVTIEDDAAGTKDNEWTITPALATTGFELEFTIGTNFSLCMAADYIDVKHLMLFEDGDGDQYEIFRLHVTESYCGSQVHASIHSIRSALLSYGVSHLNLSPFKIIGSEYSDDITLIQIYLFNAKIIEFYIYKAIADATPVKLIARMISNGEADLALDIYNVKIDGEFPTSFTTLGWVDSRVPNYVSQNLHESLHIEHAEIGDGVGTDFKKDTTGLIGLETASWTVGTAADTFEKVTEDGHANVMHWVANYTCSYSIGSLSFSGTFYLSFWVKVYDITKTVYIYIHDGTNIVGIRTSSSNWSFYDGDTTSHSLLLKVVSDKWTHFMYKFVDGGACYIYIDGVLASGFTGASAFGTGTTFVATMEGTAVTDELFLDAIYLGTSEYHARLSFTSANLAFLTKNDKLMTPDGFPLQFYPVRNLGAWTYDCNTTTNTASVTIDFVNGTTAENFVTQTSENWSIKLPATAKYVMIHIQTYTNSGGNGYVKFFGLGDGNLPAYLQNSPSTSQFCFGDLICALNNGKMYMQFIRTAGTCYCAFYIKGFYA